MRRCGWLPGAALAMLVLATSARSVRAQSAEAIDRELRALRGATALEAAGDLAGAEAALRAILTDHPQSLSALLSLERVLAMQGKTAQLIPYVDALIERDPTSAIGNQMRVRAYAMLNDVPDLEKAGAAWIAAVPDTETPYREVARVWRNRGQPERALEILQQGRKRIGSADALALELGDVYAQLNDLDLAVGEWSHAIGPDGHGFLLVSRRLAALPNGGAQLIPQLVDALLQQPSSLARRRAAAQIAIDAGLSERAEHIARAVYDDLPQEQRQGFLVETARHADGAGLTHLAYWAYDQLARTAGPPEQLLAIRNRLAELALAVGDTARAAATYRTLERAFSPGSPQRRQAIAVRIQLAARDGKLPEARQDLADYRREFPAAPELDRVASSVANALLDSGDDTAAEAVLAGLPGPQAGLARGRVYIRRGDTDRARAELLASAPALQGAQATEAIALATLLGRLSKAGGELVGHALTKSSAGERREAIKLLLDQSSSLDGLERAAILDFAAGLADRGDLIAEAEQIRRELITEEPHAPEAPGALLALARSMATRDARSDEARLMLEKLILEYPRSALVPQARQELDRLQGRVPHTE